MKQNQFVNQKKKFFANNQHHKQSEFVFGSPVVQRGGYGNQGAQNPSTDFNVDPQVETVKNLESHPIEQYWNEYKRQREAAAVAQTDTSAKVGFVPQMNSAAPQSGVNNGANFHGR